MGIRGVTAPCAVSPFVANCRLAYWQLPLFLVSRIQYLLGGVTALLLSSKFDISSKCLILHHYLPYKLELNYDKNALKLFFYQNNSVCNRV